jgi:hypothetical protein
LEVRAIIITFVFGMKEIEIIVRDVPMSWQICFLTECPVKDRCLRQLIASQLSEKRDFGPAVYPTMKRGENGCRLFVANEPQLMAWGFEKMFSEVRHRDVVSLRKEVTNELRGHSNYYRYNNGERLLSPEQQEAIIKLFQKYGYQNQLEFDHYTYVYDFDS